MSRIYDNKPLQSLPVQNHNLGGTWEPRQYQEGQGILLEGTIQARSRHVITDVKSEKTRYFVFHISVSRAHRRQFDRSGKEIEPNFSETKKVNTGFLNSSYKVEAKGDTDRLTIDEVAKIVSKQELDALVTRHRPQNCLSFWVTEQAVEHLELVEGDDVRVKTSGNGPFISSISKLDTLKSTVSNYAGGEVVGTSWTDKIMTVKSQQHEEMEDTQGADDDEWDD
ncbi:arpin [Lingula anatina]|uniref:Arpin n=1 Tax=Lingula anatina TaxID=7574 RepID=A0A1S3JKV7_LINAN|nr:arpin [Lingula anatina]|eukprot:XP_013410766.1 arpin [Lingula anatina]